MKLSKASLKGWKGSSQLLDRKESDSSKANVVSNVSSALSRDIYRFV